MAGLLIPGRRVALPVPPADIADEVERYARESGRHATLMAVPQFIDRGTGKDWTWIIKFTAKEHDGALESFQQGEVAEAPGEMVWLHEPNPRAGQHISGSHYREPDYLPLDIEEMGASGVREFLERGNAWSGRGEYDSLVEAVEDARRTNEETFQKVRAQAKEDNRYLQRDMRRQRFRIPFIGVLRDIGKRVIGA
ncbi:MAG: hypothetical protein AB7Q29_16020 [Vicinamibacterales bacterium]